VAADGPVRRRADQVEGSYARRAARRIGHAPGSRKSLQLVRASAYRASGGHEQIRLRPRRRPDARPGAQSSTGSGGIRTSGGTVNVDWYASPGAVRGVGEKHVRRLNYQHARRRRQRLSLILHAGYFLLPLSDRDRCESCAWRRWPCCLASGAGRAALRSDSRPGRRCCSQWPRCSSRGPGAGDLLTLVRGASLARHLLSSLGVAPGNQPPQAGRR